MDSSHQSAELIRALKDLLKKKGVRYSTLAENLHLSLPAVKRMMNSKEMSLSRVIAICHFLDVDLRDVLQNLSTQSNDLSQFTVEQEKFFADHLHYLAYLYKLHAGTTPKEIEKNFKISPRSTHKYLKKLEQLKLISWGLNDRIKVNLKGTLTWSDHGPLGSVISKRMVLSFANWAADKITNPQKMFMNLNGWRLTPENYQEFQKEYLELVKKYRQLSTYNSKILKQEEHDYVNIMTIADHWDEKTFSEIKEL